MITDEELKVEGLKALTEALGDVQAEKVHRADYALSV